MIVETNYSAHAVDDLRSGSVSIKKSGIANSEKISEAWSWAAQVLSDAQKFRVPDGGVLLDWGQKDLAQQCAMYAQPFRLPYPIVAIEIPHSSEATISDATALFVSQAKVHSSSKTTRRIALATEETVHGETRICITSIALLEGIKAYMLCNFFVRLQSNGTMTAGTTFPAPEGLDVSGEGFPAFVNGQLGIEINAVVQLIAALACRNVKTAESLPKPALNKGRISAKKTPFFSYHTLEIEQEIKSAERTGNGASGGVRMHLRRGHVRRLPKGQVWVNSTIVGAAAGGVVDKDYRMTRS